jgi:hypothetical protein
MPVWMANGWDGVTPVSRLELQLRRKGLKRFDRTMDFVTFQDRKADIWAYGTERFLRIVNPETATRKERAKETDYWRDYQDCDALFGQRLGVLPYKQLNPNWKMLVKQAQGCYATALAMLAVDFGDDRATSILSKECSHNIPPEIIEAGLIRKVRFSHMN